MNNTRHRSTSAVGNISHCTCNSTCNRDTAKERNSNIGNTLTYKFGIITSAITGSTIGNGSRK